MKFYFESISSSNVEIPTGHGVYAWYYLPKLSKVDIERFYTKHQDSGFTKDNINEFLSQHLFGFFEEEAYNVKLSGPLKPKYEGSVEHVDQCSNSLIESVISGNLHIHDIKNLLTNLDESFLSPIYIGMAKNLSQRVNHHKNKIRDLRTKIQPLGDIISSENDRDSNFAKRVVERGYIDSFLFVIVNELKVDEGLQSVAENIMNRINYPILGRN